MAPHHLFDSPSCADEDEDLVTDERE